SSLREDRPGGEDDQDDDERATGAHETSLREKPPDRTDERPRKAIRSLEWRVVTRGQPLTMEGGVVADEPDGRGGQSLHSPPEPLLCVGEPCGHPYPRRRRPPGATAGRRCGEVRERRAPRVAQESRANG